MTKKKARYSPTATVMIEGSPVTITLDDNPAFAELSSSLIEINKITGIKGYILKNTSTAVINLQNPTKLSEYALLFSEAVDACKKISELFNINTTKIIIEGTEFKMLCTIIGENKLSIFMEKNVDHTDVFRRISQ